MTQQTNHIGRLSTRQHEVLALVAQGYTDRQIGEKLHISPLTAHNHVYAIRAAYCASNRAEIVYRAMRAGDLT